MLCGVMRLASRISAAFVLALAFFGSSHDAFTCRMASATFQRCSDPMAPALCKLAQSIAQTMSDWLINAKAPALLVISLWLQE